MKRRRTWQHRFEDISEDQLNEFLHRLDWVVERLGRDYGEDLYVRIFDVGNPTGHDFYIQLKGTDNIVQYALKGKPYFSYPVEIINLKQWSNFTIPVVFVLWDIEKKAGYWVHVQPFVHDILLTNPNWLKNNSKAKKPTRQIHIPDDQILHLRFANNLKDSAWFKRQKKHVNK